MIESDGSGRSVDTKAELRWFLRNLDLQLDDLALTERGISIDLYWDTEAIRLAIVGMADFYKRPSFSRHLFEGKHTLVTCLAATGWLGPMRLLSPHQSELLTSLKMEFNLGNRRVPAGGANQFLRDVGITGLQELTLKIFNQKSAEEKTNVVLQFAGQAQRLFKAIQCVSGTWQDRLTALVTRNLIALQNDSTIQYADIFESSLFTDVKRELDRRRPDRSLNNITDATAICLLHRGVLDFRNGRELRLPRFYESSPLFREALAKIERSESLSYQLADGTSTSVLRDDEYFIFRATFNPPSDLADKSSQRNLIIALRKVRNEVKQMLDAAKPLTVELLDEIVVEGKALTVVIKELKECAFLETVWLPYAAGQSISEVARIYVKGPLELGEDKEFLGSVGGTIDEVKRILEANAGEFKWLSSLWRGLEINIGKFQRRFPARTTEAREVFKVFALVRFGVPFEQHDRVPQLVQALVNGDKDESERALIEIFRASRDSKYGRDETSQRSVAMCLLWLLEMDSVINDIPVSETEDPFWVLAISCASSIRARRQDSAVRCLEELIKRYRATTETELRGQLAISLSYLHFQMWRLVGGEVKWRHDRHIPSGYTAAEVAEWISSALKYAEEAYTAVHRSVATKAYALNLCVFYTTEGGSDADLARVDGLAEELIHYESDANVWIYRFADTLARNFHRRALMASKPDTKYELLAVARDYITAAASNSYGDPDVKAYQAILASASAEVR